MPSIISNIQSFVESTMAKSGKISNEKVKRKYGAKVTKKFPRPEEINKPPSPLKTWKPSGRWKVKIAIKLWVNSCLKIATYESALIVMKHKTVDRRKEAQKSF